MKDSAKLKDQLFSILDGLDAIVYVADMQSHKILFANKYTKDLFGDITGTICWQTLQGNQSGPCSFCTNNKLINKDLFMLFFLKKFTLKAFYARWFRTIPVKTMRYSLKHALKKPRHTRLKDVVILICVF